MAPVRPVGPVVVTIHGSIISISVVRIATVGIVVAMMVAIDGAQYQCRCDSSTDTPAPSTIRLGTLAEPKTAIKMNAAVATSVVRFRALIGCSVLIADRSGA